MGVDWIGGGELNTRDVLKSCGKVWVVSEGVGGGTEKNKKIILLERHGLLVKREEYERIYSFSHIGRFSSS